MTAADLTTAKHARFKALHEAPGAFVVPNPWNAGTAIMLETLGFEALATTSAGVAFSAGRPDGTRAVSREEMLANAAEIVEATALPVTADLENGFGDDPSVCVETIRMASAVGLVGGSIEDATGRAQDPIYPFEAAVERVAAAAEAARDLPFLLTARCENFLHGRPDLEDTIRRLRAFAEAGAGVVYAPGLRDLASIRTVCEAVDRPVNVVMGLTGPTITVSELADAGVKRVSVGGSMARAAYGAFLRAAREIRERGSFEYAKEAVPGDEIEAFFR